jgi:hypothetical protein
MGLLGAATDKPQFELTPVGEYVWTLWDLLSETGQYGEQVKWVWLISPVSEPDAYLTRSDGQQEKEVWQFTKPSIAKGSRARAWTEALMGRELRTGEEPDDSDLIRKRMVALLVHKQNKNDPTIKREAISEEIPPRPFRAAQPVSRPAAAMTPNDDVEAQLAASDELRKRVKKLIRNADLDDIGYLDDGTVIEDIDVSNLADGDLRVIEQQLRAALKAAAAA